MKFYICSEGWHFYKSFGDDGSEGIAQAKLLQVRDENNLCHCYVDHHVLLWFAYCTHCSISEYTVNWMYT